MGSICTSELLCQRSGTVHFSWSFASSSSTSPASLSPVPTVPPRRPELHPSSGLSRSRGDKSICLWTAQGNGTHCQVGGSEPDDVCPLTAVLSIRQPCQRCALKQETPMSHLRSLGSHSSDLLASLPRLSSSG